VVRPIYGSLGAKGLKPKKLNCGYIGVYKGQKIKVYMKVVLVTFATFVLLWAMVHFSGRYEQ
jgi:hypothetical protein